MMEYVKYNDTESNSKNLAFGLVYFFDCIETAYALDCDNFIEDLNAYIDELK